MKARARGVIEVVADRTTAALRRRTPTDRLEIASGLPAKAHLTLPASWKSRRLQVPVGVALHFADLDDADRAWAGVVRLTTPARTVVDSAAAGVSPGLVTQAIDEGLRRGLFTEPMVATAREYLRSLEAGEP